MRASDRRVDSDTDTDIGSFPATVSWIQDAIGISDTSGIADTVEIRLHDTSSIGCKDAVENRGVQCVCGSLH